MSFFKLIAALCTALIFVLVGTVTAIAFALPQTVHNIKCDISTDTTAGEIACNNN